MERIYEHLRCAVATELKQWDACLYMVHNVLGGHCGEQKQRLFWLCFTRRHLYVEFLSCSTFFSRLNSGSFIILHLDVTYDFRFETLEKGLRPKSCLR